MNKIKEKFKTWLLKQGLAEKTKSGRPGTIYEYLKRIDRLSCQLYGKEDWEQILKQIYVLYILHTTLDSKKYKGTKPQKIYDFITNYGRINYINDTSTTIIDGNYIHPKYIKKYLKCLESNQQRIHSIRTALEKLYDFYSLNEDIFNEINNIQIIQADPQKPKKNVIFKGYRETISQTKEMMDTIYELKVPREADALKPRLIKGEDSTYGRVKKHLMVKEAALSLECSEKTLRRLASKRKNKFGVDGYSIRAIQRYLKNHHHPSRDATSSLGKSNIKDWITGREASDLLHCPLTTFIRKYRDTGLVAYTNYTPRKVRYYKPDIIKQKNKQ